MPNGASTRLLRSCIRRWFGDHAVAALSPANILVPAASGAIVMGTGIVSIALSLDRDELLSAVWLALTAAAWVLLAAIAVNGLARNPRRVRADARSPGGLTAAAGTSVLGSRLLIDGFRVEAVALLIVAVVIWPGLCGAVLKNRPLPRTGSSFMLVVAVQSISVLAAMLSAAEHTPWMLYGAIGACGLGVALYPFVLVRFELRELLAGSGDHWVAGGALAISALAFSELSLTATRLGVVHAAVPPLNTLAVVTWAAAVAWVPALVGGEVLVPRPRYDLRRWATVFPVGMYAVASFEVAHAARLHALDSFAAVVIWVAVAVWLVVVAGMTRRGARRVAR